MSDFFLKDVGYEDSPVAMAKELIATSHTKKVYWWRKCYVECATGVCMLLVSPLLLLLIALLLVSAVLRELSGKAYKPDTLGQVPIEVYNWFNAPRF
jgi:hypothetical protein